MLRTRVHSRSWSRTWLVPDYCLNCFEFECECITPQIAAEKLQESVKRAKDAFDGANMDTKLLDDLIRTMKGNGVTTKELSKFIEGMNKMQQTMEKAREVKYPTSRPARNPGLKGVR